MKRQLGSRGFFLASSSSRQAARVSSRARAPVRMLRPVPRATPVTVRVVAPAGVRLGTPARTFRLLGQAEVGQRELQARRTRAARQGPQARRRRPARLELRARRAKGAAVRPAPPGRPAAMEVAAAEATQARTRAAARPWMQLLSVRVPPFPKTLLCAAPHPAPTPVRTHVVPGL